SPTGSGWRSSATRCRGAARRSVGTEPFRAAVVQAAPAFLEREATIARAADLIDQAGRNGARLVVFPEAFVPGYPDWAWSVPADPASWGRPAPGGWSGRRGTGRRSRSSTRRSAGWAG